MSGDTKIRPQQVELWQGNTLQDVKPSSVVSASLKQKWEGCIGRRVKKNIVAGFITNFDLPMPDEGEFYRTNESGMLVFLSHEGLVVRLADNNYCPLIDHPRNLRPLYSRLYGHYRLDILPGIDNDIFRDKKPPTGPLNKIFGWRYYEMKKISKEIDQSGLQFWDKHSYNFGCLTSSYKNYHVLVDAGAVIGLSKKTMLAKAVLARVKSVFGVKDIDRQDPQQILFGKLSKALYEAWPLDQDKPNSKKMKTALKTAVTMRRRGVLMASWRTCNYKGTSQAAYRYHLKRFPLDKQESSPAACHHCQTKKQFSFKF